MSSSTRGAPPAFNIWMARSVALITGISGQDGAYLAQLLLEKNYEVHGTSRDAALHSLAGLERLGLLPRVRMHSMVTTDFRSVLQTLHQVRPAEIYHFAGQSSVGLSFDQPVETLDSVAIGTLNLLEAIRFLGRPTRFYHAASSECFGDTHGEPANEETPFRPRSPYAVAKCAAFWEVANYREAYGLFACSGLLFNHESPLRPERFVTTKIVAAACRIAQGSEEKLALGNLDISRDWGWAPEYVEAMWKMLQRDRPEDFVVATGATSTLKDFACEAFGQVGLNWQEHVEVQSYLLRPSDLQISRANPEKARRLLPWKAKLKMKEVVAELVRSRLGQGKPA